MKHPIQPIETERGSPRFKQNSIVLYLLRLCEENKLCDMNRLACMSFTKDDRVQFAQLIGYSLNGFSELGYVDDDTYNAAEHMAAGKTMEQAKIETLEGQLRAIRIALREPMAHLFGVHPDDLNKNIEGQ